MPPPPSLAERLRAGTRALHTEVEHSAFMQALLKGRLDRPGYCLLLRNLHPLYAALEAALTARRQHPAVAPLYLPEVFRARTLAADLEVLHGPAWASALPVLPAAAAYAAHLEALAPELLVAHLYVRSLGDLNGGQVLARLVAEGLGAGLPGGTAFYDFGGPERTRALALELRGRLAALPLSSEDEAAVVVEARGAFERHRALFAQLAVEAGL